MPGSLLVLALSGVSTTPTVTFASTQPLGQPDYYGVSLSHGDVNGDGYVDVLIGASQADGATPGDWAGAVYIFHGSASGFAASPDTTLTGVGPGDQLGLSAAVVGDVDGDGYDDVAVGAYTADQRGRVSLHLGSPSGINPMPAAQFTGENTGDVLFPVFPAGDVDGDGYADFLLEEVGYASGAGRVRLYLGSADGPPATPSQTFTGEGPGDLLGSCVAGDFDMNGDGFDDVVIGRSPWNGYVGQALVFQGSATGLSATPVATLSGDGVALAFGGAAASAGDVDGDGYDDVLVGAIGDAELRGHVYLYPGSATGLSTTPAATLVGGAANALLGLAMAGAGDVNHDGYGDVILGATGPEAEKTGHAFVFLGTSAGLSQTPGTVLDGRAADDFFGSNVTGAGDLDGDGNDDVLVSSPGAATVTAYGGYGPGGEDTGADSGGDTGADSGQDTSADTAGRLPNDTQPGCGCVTTTSTGTGMIGLGLLVLALRRR